MIADVVGSRKLPDRPGFGHHLESLIETLNQRHASVLQSPLMISKGIDTLVAVLANASGIFPLALELMLGLKPHVVRLSFAAGEIDVNPGLHEARLMDGPAFHFAARQIERLERDHELLGICGFGPSMDLLLQPAAALFGQSIMQLTSHQANIMLLYRVMGSQEAVAERLAISQQAVSDALRKARYDFIERNLQRLQNALACLAPILLDPI
jgi:hypothetical protein